jgi:hypothetical protein
LWVELSGWMLSAPFQQDTAVLQPGHALDDGDFDAVDDLSDPDGLEIRLSTRLAIPLFEGWTVDG